MCWSPKLLPFLSIHIAFPSLPSWPRIGSRLTWLLACASRRELAVDKKTVPAPTKAAA